MNKYLIDLLSDVNTVIIPGFGALTVVNRANKDYMFMPYLKYDDGLLVDFIAQKENWTKDEVKDLIAKYVHDISITINKGGTYDFTDIGSFKMAGEEIVFENWKEKTYFTKTTAPSTIIVETSEEVISTPESSPEVEEDVEIPLETPVVTTPVVDNPADEEDKEADHSSATTLISNPANVVAGIIASPETTAEVEEPEKIDIRVEEPVSNEVIEPEVIAPIEPEEEVKPVMRSEEEQWNDPIDIPPVNYNPPKPKTPILHKLPKDKKPRRTSPILLGLLVLVLLGGLGAAGFYWNDIQKLWIVNAPQVVVDIHDEENDVIDKEVTDQDTKLSDTSEEFSEMDELVKDEEDRKPTEQQTTAPANVNGNIDKSLPLQVIAGSFEDQTNAERLIQQLESQNIPAQIIGMYNGMHFVSIGSFQTEQEYQSKKAQLQTAGPHWLFRKK